MSTKETILITPGNTKNLLGGYQVSSKKSRCLRCKVFLAVLILAATQREEKIQIDDHQKEYSFEDTSDAVHACLTVNVPRPSVPSRLLATAILLHKLKVISSQICWTWRNTIELIRTRSGTHSKLSWKNHTVHVGVDHTIPVPYKVRGDHQIIHVGDRHVSIPYKVWGNKVPTFHIKYGGP